MGPNMGPQQPFPPNAGPQLPPLMLPNMGPRQPFPPNAGPQLPSMLERFNAAVDPNRVMPWAIGGAGGLALGMHALYLGSQQPPIQPEGMSPVVAPGPTPAEKELEAYYQQIMGYNPAGADAGLPSLDVGPPSPINLPARPEILAKIQEMQRYAPGAEGMLTPEDKWGFILSGLAQGAAASGGDDLGEALWKMGAGMLAGSAKYGLTRREQEGEKAKETRDWQRQMAQLEASAMANEYSMDLARAKLQREEDVYKNSLALAKYNADTGRYNATKGSAAGMYSNAMKAKAQAMMQDPILGSEMMQFIPPGDVTAIMTEEGFKPPPRGTLDDKMHSGMVSQMIWDRWCQKNPQQCREVAARYRQSRMSKALGGG